jgi:hypothetical protein
VNQRRLQVYRSAKATWASGFAIDRRCAIPPPPTCPAPSNTGGVEPSREFVHLPAMKRVFIVIGMFLLVPALMGDVAPPGAGCGCGGAGGGGGEGE